MGKDKRIVVLSDMQIPYHDKKLVNKVINFVHDYQPDVLACVGDEADSPEPSRWTKGMAGEYAGTLQRGLDETHNVLSLFRAVIGDIPFIIHRSNHGDRIRNYIDKYAPALGSLRDLEYESLLGFDQLGIKQTRQPYPIAPGWLMVHGDEGGSSRIAGGTAMALARKFGKSVVCGHCFDEETEILTRDGWKNHTELKHGDDVLTMNRETQALEYGPIQQIVRYKNTEPLLRVKANGLDIAVTAKHGLVTKSRKDGSLSFPTAEEAYGKEATIPHAGIHDEQGLDISLDHIRLLAWVMAEGCLERGNSVRIAQSDTPDGSLQSLEDCLEANGIDLKKVHRYTAGETEHGVHRNYDAYRYSIGVEDTRRLILPYMDGNKDPLPVLRGMSAKQMEVFLKTYTLADGHTYTSRSSQLSSRDRLKIDFLQELCVRTGRRTSITSHDGLYYMAVNTRSEVRVKPSSWSRMEHDGTVWCVSVPNGTLVVRRNGKTAITQNTHKQGIVHEHTSYSGVTNQSRFGFEVGHMMDMKQADYLKAGDANWQAGFGLLTVSGGKTFATPVPVLRGSFTVDGVTY